MFSRNSRFSSVRRSAIVRCIAAVGLGAAVSLTWAQANWPVKPVAFVVGYPPGGQTDFAGRVILPSMQTTLGQSLVVENKGGAGGNIAAVDVVKAAPDGYRLMIGNGNITINPHTYSAGVGMVDPLKFTPIGIVSQAALVLAVPSTSPIKSYAELVSWIKAQEKAHASVDYGTSGPGSLTHITTELWRDKIGNPQMNHIPYKGAGPAMIDLIAGRVNFMFDATSSMAPFIKSGQLRPLMVTSAKRVAAFPEVPTAAEVGLKDFEIAAFIGLYGPPGLSPDIVKKVNNAMNIALKDAKVQRSFIDRGEEPGGGTPEQLAAITKGDYKRWGEVVKAKNIRVE